MAEPVLFHCAYCEWEFRRDPNLTGEEAEYDIKSAMHAHVLMSLIYQRIPSSAHKFRSGPALSSTTGPGSQSDSSRPE